MEKIQELENLFTEYANNLNSQMNEIEILWQRIQTEQGLDDMKVLYRIVHHLHGSAANFGYQNLSIAAEKLEHCLANCEKGAKLSTSEKNAIKQLIDILIMTARTEKQDRSLLEKYKAK